MHGSSVGLASYTVMDTACEASEPCGVSEGPCVQAADGVAGPSAPGLARETSDGVADACGDRGTPSAPGDGGPPAGTACGDGGAAAGGLAGEAREEARVLAGVALMVVLARIETWFGACGVRV